MRFGTNTLITIRTFLPEDKDPILALLKETDVFTEEEIGVATELMDVFLHDHKQKDYDIYTALADQTEVVGYLCIGRTPLTHGTFDLYWLAVKPSYHRSRVGKQLLQHAEHVVKSNSGRLLLTETSSQPNYEKTRTFYIKNEYSEVARIKDYYKIGDDLVIYGKYLSQQKGS